METVHELLESRRRDGAPALIDAASGETLVGTALAARVGGRARALVAAGVRSGARVPLLVPISLPSPREMEETLPAPPGVGEAAVVGAPDPLYGEVVGPFPPPRPGARLDEGQVLAWCATRL